MNWIEIQVTRLMIWFLLKGYGPKCTTKDTDDFPGLEKNPQARCACCQAHETIEFLEEHLDLLKW